MSTQAQAILAVFLEDVTRPQYGLDLAKAAGLPTGTIYPTLARFEREGWLTSRQEDVDPKVAGRRPRRYYLLTGEGQRVARSELARTLRQLGPALTTNRPVST
jgi:PadR family transcriptional regulator, regulatory protein PadR